MSNTETASEQSARVALEKKLAQRPDKQELIDHNILPASNVAPALQAAQKELERSLLEDTLDSKLKNRPPAEQLVKEGILQKDEAPPS